MKKTLSPLVYTAFLTPTLIGTIICLNLIEKYFGLSRFTMVGLPEAIFSLTILSLFIFWLANKTINGLEKLHIPTIKDHLRQTLLCYLIGANGFIRLFSKGYHGGLGEAVFYMTSYASILAIIINAFFLLQRRKANIS